MPSVQHGDGEEIEYREVEAQESHEADKRAEPGPGTLTGKLGDDHGSAQRLDGFLSGDQAVYGNNHEFGKISQRFRSAYKSLSHACLPHIHLRINADLADDTHGVSLFDLDFLGR